jgi:hypothetical protein
MKRGRGSSVLVFISLTLLPIACSCVDQIRSDVPSPDGAYIAAFFERNCGATTDYVTHVSLRRSDLPLSRSDDVLIMEFRQDITMRWLEPRRLLIEYRKCANDPGAFRIRSVATSWRGVVIEHREGAAIDPASTECREIARRPSS